MARKLALIIGNSQYQDAGLAKLAAPDVDVRALAEVLRTPHIGAFDEVTPLLNEGLANVRRAIAQFFDRKHRDDLLFLYFSGHGVRDEQGHLYLAVRDTERAVLAGTAIEASYVTTRMDRSASKRLVLVLDCCHSGAFGLGSKSAQVSTVGTASAFEGSGRGRVVLTATDSTQYAWEGDQVIGEVENSLFTHYLIEGLRSGDADIDQDGQITIDELYDYIYEHVLNETPKQTPGKWTFGQQGDIVIAQNPVVTVPKLPVEVEEALKSTLPSVRFQVLNELVAIVRGRHEGRSKAARAALDRLAEDDSRKVAAGALVLKETLESDETLTEEEWLRRVLERERRISSRKTAPISVASIPATAATHFDKGDEAGQQLGPSVAGQVKGDEAAGSPPVGVIGRQAQGSIFGPTLPATVRWVRANTFSSTAMRIVAGVLLVLAVTVTTLNRSTAPPTDFVETPRPTPQPTPHVTEPAKPPESLPGLAEAPPPSTAIPEKSGSETKSSGRVGGVITPVATGPKSGTADKRTAAPGRPERKPEIEKRNPATAASGTPPAGRDAPTGERPREAKTTDPPKSEPKSEPPRDVRPTEPAKPEAERTSPTSPSTEPKPPEPKVTPARLVPDEASLRSAVQAYAQAFSSGKREAVKAVFPSVSEKELAELDSLKDNFGDDRYVMSILIRSNQVEGHRARVRCVIFHSGVDNTGKPLQQRREVTLQFDWTGATWVRVR
jgi:hypothetical protein